MQCLDTLSRKGVIVSFDSKRCNKCRTGLIISRNIEIKPQKGDKGEKTKKKNIHERTKRKQRKKKNGFGYQTRATATINKNSFF